MEIHERTASDLKKMLDKREISAEQVITALFERIESLDPKLKAFITTSKKQAIKEARESDKRRSKGKAMGILEGIPIAIKDNICTRGMKTTCASRMLKDFFPPYDAHAIERIKSQGGIVVGKTNLDEFAMGSSCENSAMFPTCNPWNIEYAPGGSSGGSACAVASGMVPLALGSDTGGSVRQPAALCGVYGFKPTYGRVSRYGLVAFASSLDQIGPFGRSAEDIALCLKAIAGHDRRDATSLDVSVPDYEKCLGEPLNGKKIGIPKQYFVNGNDPEVSRACGKSIEALKKAGAKACEISLPHTEYALAVYSLIATAEASANLARYDGIHYGYRTNEKRVLSKIKKRSEKKGTEGKALGNDPGLLEELYSFSRAEGLGPEVKRRILLGTYALSTGYYDAYYLKALKVRTRVQQEIDLALQSVDVLVTPTSPIAAFKLGEKTMDPLSMYLCDVFTVTFSLSGNPAISVPCGLTHDGMPIGFQIVGRRFEEETVLRFASAHERYVPPIGMPVL